jgi:hypothetical protein
MALLVVVASLGFAGSARADTEGNPNASCMGHEASWASPPGTHDPADHPFGSRGMPGILDFVDVVAGLLGLPNRGAVISSGPATINGDRTIATHEECDEALGIPEGAE